MQTNIEGIPKGRLLTALWICAVEHAPTVRMFEAADLFDRKEAEASASDRRLNYFHGVAIKTDLTGPTADGRQYDYHTAPGAFAAVVAAEREFAVVDSVRESAVWWV